MTTNGEEEESAPAITWGTAALKAGFTGVIVESVVKKSEKTFGDKPPADQLYILIQPTSYDPPEDQKMWPKAWYNISTARKSKWAALQERLENNKCLPKKGPEDLLGLEFEWERVNLEFGKDRDGVKMTADDVLLPKKLLRDTKKTKSGAKAPAPSAPVTPAPTDEKEKVDIESLIVQMLESEPVAISDLYKSMAKDHNIQRAEVFKAMKSLEKQGMVKMNTADGMLVKGE